MSKRIRLFALAVAILMCFASVAGCGKNEDPNTGDNDFADDDFSSMGSAQQKWIDLFGEEYVKERADYEAENPPYQVPDELKGTTVKFATWIDHTTTEAKYAMQNFEAATGIKVEWIEVPQSGYMSQIASMVATGTAPDVILENNESWPKSLEVSMPLNTIKSIDMNDPIWDQGYFKFSTFGGNTYNCNTRNSVWQTVHLLYYNKKALSENGIATPQNYIEAGEWNVDNMIKVMREFKALSDSNEGGTVGVTHLALANGSEFMYMKDGRFVSGINDSVFTDAMKVFYDIKDKNLYGGSQAGLLKGTVGVYTTDSYGLKKTGYFKGVDEDLLGFAPIPTATGDKQIVASHYRAYAVCKGAANPEGAGYFLRYFLDPYNYNWEDIFISEDAKQAYLNYCADIPFENKCFGFELCGTALLGYDDWEGLRKWEVTINRGTGAQLQTYLASMSNEINTAVAKSNQIIDSLS